VFWQLVEKDYIDRDFIHLDAAVVIDRAECTEAIHEEAHPRPCRPIISANVSCEMGGMKVSRSPGLPNSAMMRRITRQAFSLEIEKLNRQDLPDSHAAGYMNFRRSREPRSSCITRAISSLVILSATHELTAEAVAKRQSRNDASDSSPTKSPAERSVIVASLPFLRDDREFCPAGLKKKTVLAGYSLGEEGLFWSNSTICDQVLRFAEKQRSRMPLCFFGLSKYSPVLCSLPGWWMNPRKSPCDWKCPAIVANHQSCRRRASDGNLTQLAS